MNIVYIALQIIVVVTAVTVGVVYLHKLFKTTFSDDSTTTRPLPEIDDELDIPQEDQDYLEPILVLTLKHLAAVKRAYPTNAQLVNHLAEALGQASGSFEKRTKDNQQTQTKNENWLYVAVLAIRLYDEGTPHNADSTREQMVTMSVLAEREIMAWARAVNEQITQSVKKKSGITGDVVSVQSHAQHVAGTPYTADEVEDLKKAHELKLLKRNK